MMKNISDRKKKFLGQEIFWQRTQTILHSGPNKENVFGWQWISEAIFSSAITITKWSKIELGALEVFWHDVLVIVRLVWDVK